jgi:tight adherence protein B
MSTLLIALGVGIGAYILFIIAVPKAVPKDSDDYLKSALNRLAEENKAAEQARTDVLRDQLSDAPPLVRIILGSPFMRPIYELALEAGYINNLQQVLIIMLLSGAIALAGGILLGLGPLSLIIALVVAYLYPMRHCRKLIRKRNRKFIDQFPDALDMIVRSVRSGFPLSVALQMLAENAEEPVRSEFRQVTDEVALGRNLSQALTRLSARINEPDIRFFVVVLTVQQETGGNLAEIVGNLSSIIRKRKQLRHKIRAMTSEGKATGYVLGALPVLVFFALYFIQPGYLEPFFDDPTGREYFGVAIGLLVACFFVIKQMIAVEI